MQLLQNEVDRTRIEWNSHRLRPVRNSVCPSGHPNELFHLPQLLGKNSIICLFITVHTNLISYRCTRYPLDARDIPHTQEYTEAPDPPASLEFLELAQLVMDANAPQLPQSIEQAIHLYVTLTCTIEAHIQ